MASESGRVGGPCGSRLICGRSRSRGPVTGALELGGTFPTKETEFDPLGIADNETGLVNEE